MLPIPGNLAESVRALSKRVRILESHRHGEYMTRMTEGPVEIRGSTPEEVLPQVLAVLSEIGLITDLTNL